MCCVNIWNGTTTKAHKSDKHQYSQVIIYMPFILPQELDRFSFNQLNLVNEVLFRMHVVMNLYLHKTELAHLFLNIYATDSLWDYHQKYQNKILMH